MNLRGHEVFIVGLAGPSGSGKSTVADRVATRLSGHVLSMETYTKPQTHLSLEERNEVNYDAPEALDIELLAEQVRQLACGHAIEAPVYDFGSHQRMERSEKIEPAPLLIVAGILALHYAELRPYYNFSIYLDAPDNVCLHRRKVRDIVDRQRSIEHILWQYQEMVLPMAQKYLLPSKPYANVVIDGEPRLAAVEQAVEQAIQGAMAMRGSVAG